MRGVSVFIFIAFLSGWSSAQYLNNRPYPTYSLERMPDTDFTCRDKILGGYYADAETQCQMFHVCVKVAGVGVQDFRFLCPNGTAFDQDHQICADWDDVDCDATTLYYSSDNFDLYRIGSGFESKAVKYGEDEEAFALQRAETGDVRLNREHQTQRVNQQKENTYRPRQNNQFQQTNRNYNSNNNNAEKDIFKSSSSSNFFNNRNNGKETEDEDDDETYYPNANQNNDNYQRRKNARTKQNRRPDIEDEQARTTARSPGFSNNFAGSSYVPSTSRPSTTTTTIASEQRPLRQRTRVNPQYNNADNFRQTQRNYDDGQYRENSNSNTGQISVSTPAPFSRQKPTTTTLAPKPTTQNYPQAFSKEQESYAFKRIESNNYQSTTSGFNNNYEVTKTKTENYPVGFNAQKKPTTPFKQPENYPTTFSPKTNPFKHEYYTTTSTVAPQNRQINYNDNKQVNKYTPSANYDNKQSTEYTPFTNYDNKRFTSTPKYDNKQYTESTNYDNKQNTQYPSSANYQNTQSTKYDNKQFTQNTNQYTPTTNYDNKQKNTYTPEAKQNNQYTPTTNYDNKQKNTYTPEAKQNNQYTPTTNYDNKQKNTYTPEAQQNNQYTPSTNYDNKQNTQSYDNKQYTNKQTTQYNPTTQQKQTTQYTQYTPTVPRITTPYYSTTAPSNSRRSNRYDETQYDDGSYSGKYNRDDESEKDDEFLKTAHSINIASSRNEYVQNNRNVQVSSTEKPRPFSVTPNSPKPVDFVRVTNGGPKQGGNANKPPTIPQQQQQQQPAVNNAKNNNNNNKKTKDVSYDYAYYDTNIGSDHDYDIGVDIEKAGKSKNTK